MGRKLIIGTAVAALALAAPAWAASPLDEYQQTGHITPCRYSSNQLQGSVPNDVAQYAPEYASQLQAAARQRASGCGGAARAGASGRGGAAGGAGGRPGSSSAASGAAAPGASAVAAATARKVRTRARTRRRARTRARLTAATVAPGDISADARVPDRALLLAALPILLLLALAAALRTWESVGRRARLARDPARTPSGAIILPPPVVGNGNGNGAAEAAAAEAPTEEAAAVYPPATSRRRKTRYAAKSDGTA